MSTYKAGDLAQLQDYLTVRLDVANEIIDAAGTQVMAAMEAMIWDNSAYAGLDPHVPLTDSDLPKIMAWVLECEEVTWSEEMLECCRGAALRFMNGWNEDGAH